LVRAAKEKSKQATISRQHTLHDLFVRQRPVPKVFQSFRRNWHKGFEAGIGAMFVRQNVSVSCNLSAASSSM
jgi:hypothetical protein